ncbi:MAG: hypothetical protein ACK4YP_02400 [Myxococcota bacterium]
MWHGKPPFAIVAVLAVVTTSTASASEMGARSMARGGVGLADSGDAAGEERNLAAVSLDPRYVMFAGAGLGPDGSFLLRGGALDSRTSIVALGAGYRRLTDAVTPTGDELPGWHPAGEEIVDHATWQRVHLGLALPFAERRVSIAALTRFDWRSSMLSGKSYAFNFGFSAAARPVEGLTVALGARDLLGNAYPRIDREADLAVRYSPGPRFGVEADVTAPIDKDFGVDRFQWRAGLDGGVADWLALRGGWSMEAGTHFASAGIGLVSEQAVLDYGVKVQLDDPARNWHALDLRVNF